LVLPGVPQHVVQRGHNREPGFFAEADYQRYLHDFHEAALKNRVQIHTYALMSNHVHLLLTPETRCGLSHLMQDTGRTFVRYINSAYKRTGSLWEVRYRASLTDGEVYLLTLYALYRNEPGASRHEQEYAYRELFRCDLDSGEVHPIREALNQEPVLGREEFKDRIEQMLNRQARPGAPGRPRIEDESAHYSAL